jgi:hypothetical protein
MTYLRSCKFSMIMSPKKPQMPYFAYLRHFLYSTKECQAALLLERDCAYVVLFCSDALMCTVHCHTYVHDPLSHLCARSTVTLMCTVHCHTYVHDPLSHLCSRSTVTLMCTVHCHTYVHGPLSHLCARSTGTLYKKYLSSKCHRIIKDHAPYSVE